MSKDKKTRKSKVLRLLLAGNTLNRKSIGDMGVGVNNYSLHSDISDLINEKYVPIESKRLSDQTHDYTMTPEEIERYKAPLLRPQQEKEMRLFVNAKRELRANKFLLSVANQGDITSTINQELSRQATQGLKTLVSDISALLEKQGVEMD